jgi:hypothetical protein
MFSYWPFSSNVPNQNLCVTLLVPAYYIPRPSYPQFYHQCNISRVQIMNIFSMEFLSASCYFTLLGPDIFSYRPFLGHP